MDRIHPALSPEEWEQHRYGPIALRLVGDETHLVISDPDGGIVSVSGAQEVYALMALANHCLPNDDARKFTVTDIAVCRILLERLLVTERDARLSFFVSALSEKITALLPPR